MKRVFEPFSVAPRTAYVPIQPNGDMWISGVGESPHEAFSNVQALEGFITWAECEELGWFVVAAKIQPI